jgi:hypothetical protein
MVLFPSCTNDLNQALKALMLSWDQFFKDAAHTNKI